jgi:hypothetical protein
MSIMKHKTSSFVMQAGPASASFAITPHPVEDFDRNGVNITIHRIAERMQAGSNGGKSAWPEVCLSAAIAVQGK